MFKKNLPLRLCINPECGQEFYQIHGGQTHCHPECQKSKNNKEGKEKQQQIRDRDKYLRKNDKTLEKLFLQPSYNDIDGITSTTLIEMGYDFNKGVLEQNELNGLPIKWNIDYGIEPILETKGKFIIHYKTFNNDYPYLLPSIR